MANGKSSRSTGDWLVIGIAATVCFVIVLTTITVLFTKLLHPDANTSGANSVLQESIAALIALLAGFLAGASAAGHRNGNGKTPKPPLPPDAPDPSDPPGV